MSLASVGLFVGGIVKKRIGVDKDAPWHKVIDLDTGKEIKGCIAADDEIGEYEAYVFQTGGALELDGYGDPVIEYKKGNIKLINMKEKEDALRK